MLYICTGISKVTEMLHNWGMYLLVRMCRSKEIMRDYVVIKHSSIIHECSQWRVHRGHYSLLNFWQQEGTNLSVYWTSSIRFCQNTHRKQSLHIYTQLVECLQNNILTTEMKQKKSETLREMFVVWLSQLCIQLGYAFFFLLLK